MRSNKSKASSTFRRASSKVSDPDNIEIDELDVDDDGEGRDDDDDEEEEYRALEIHWWLLNSPVLLAALSVDLLKQANQHFE